MHQERVTYLLQQYLDNHISKEELKELMTLMNDEQASGMVNRAMEAMLDTTAGEEGYDEAEWDPLVDNIMDRADASRDGSRLRIIWRRLAVAAAAVLAAVGIWLLWHRETPAAATVASIQHPAADRAPGGDKAVLTLADGTNIQLDAAKDGVVGTQGSEELVKTKDAQLIYKTGQDARAADPEDQLSYNILKTPRGGQYKLVLPDGSKVWLNAASSLRYPTRFEGKNRVVELKGEAYFEIAANAAMPFKVRVSSESESDPMDVEVLGTHFNIMAYDDEPVISTTLLEGGIRVVKGAKSVLVHPGEQASLDNRDLLKVGQADIEEAVAWKDGMFRFNGADIEQVMRQLSRWYDMDVVYVNGVPKDRFQGELYRNVSIMKVLKVLEASGVHFSVEGKKLLVRL